MPILNIMQFPPKIAILGAGRWGKNLIREFSKTNVLISGCLTKGNLENLKWLNKEYPSVKVFKSYDEILEDKTITCVVIATPIKTHYELARQALLAGKNVFVEKPMAENANQAKKLVELATDKKLVLFVGYIFLYHPILKKIREIIEKEDVKYIKMLWEKFGTFYEKIELNLLPHDLSIILTLLGMPRKINITSSQNVLTETDIITLHAKYQKLAVDIEINRVSNQKRKTVTFFTSKAIYVWENNKLFKMALGQKDFTLIVETRDQPLEIECQEFLKSLATNKPAPTNGAFGLAVTELLAKI